MHFFNNQCKKSPQLILKNQMLNILKYDMLHEKKKNVFILKELQCRIYMSVPYMYFFHKKEAKATHISSAIKNSL